MDAPNNLAKVAFARNESIKMLTEAEQLIRSQLYRAHRVADAPQLHTNRRVDVLSYRKISILYV